MELTPEERRRIYEEEAERLKAQKAIKTEDAPKLTKSAIIALSIVLGLPLFLTVSCVSCLMGDTDKETAKVVDGYTSSISPDKPTSESPAKVAEGAIPSGMLPFGQTDNGDASFIHSDSMRKDGNALNFWQKVAFASGSASKAQIEEMLGRGDIEYIMSNYLADCSGRKMKGPLQTIAYSPQGRVVYQDEQSASQVAWAYPTPDTVMDATVEFACIVAEKKGLTE